LRKKVETTIGSIPPKYSSSIPLQEEEIKSF